MSDRDDEERLLREIADKGGVGIVAFGVERVLSLAFPFVVTAGLGAATYGYLSVLRRVRTVLDEVLTGLSAGHSRTIPRYDEPGQRSVLFASLMLVAGVGVVLCSAVVAVRSQIVARSLFEMRHLPTLAVFAAGLVPTVLLVYVASVFRAYRRVRRSVLVSRVARPGAVLLGALVAVAAGATGATGVWLAVVTTLAIVATVAVATVVLATPLGIDAVRTAPVGDFLTYVAGTSLVGLLGAGQRQVVFVLMAVVLSPVGAGLFSLSLLVAGVVRWPLKGINRALSAIAAELYDNNETAAIEQLYRRTSRVAAFLTVPVVVLTVSHAREILTAFSAAYGPGAPVLGLAVAGQFVAVLAGSNGLLLLMTDNERPAAVLHLLHVLVVLPVMVVLARRYGVVGLGAAYAFSLLFNNATELWLLRRLEGFRLFTREHWLVAGLCALAALCGSAIAAVTPPLLSLPGTVALTVGVTALIHRRLLTGTDRRMVTVMFRREEQDSPD